MKKLSGVIIGLMLFGSLAYTYYYCCRNSNSMNVDITKGCVLPARSFASVNK